jgi:uncharacterized protein YjiS (DUF1127 family)
MPTPREILTSYSQGDPVVYTRLVLVVQAILEGRSPVLEDPDSAPVAEDIVANLELLELEWFQEGDPDWELEEQPGFEDFRDFLRAWRRQQVQQRLRWHLKRCAPRAFELRRKTGRTYSFEDVALLEKYEAQEKQARRILVEIVSRMCGEREARRFVNALVQLSLSQAAICCWHEAKKE